MEKTFKVVKKDGTKEDFNVQKVVVAVNKSAYRALIMDWLFLYTSSSICTKSCL